MGLTSLADYNSMSKFLNRILGIEAELQNRLFKYFTDTLASIVLQAKHNGRWDMGIVGESLGDYFLWVLPIGCIVLSVEVL